MTAPRRLSDGDLSDLLTRQQFATLATNTSNGHPHLSTMLYSWDPQARLVRLFTKADRIKVKHLRRDPRAALHVQGADVWSFAVAEGDADVSEPTMAPGDAVGQEILVAIPEAFRPDDEAAFLAQLVAERRVVIRLRVHRLYGAELNVA